MDCPFEINGVSTPTKGWVDDVSTDFAIEWMKQNRDRPFSMVVGFKSPHSPRGGKNLPERLRNLYAGETSRPTPNCSVPAIFHKPDPKTGKHAAGLADNAVHLDYLRHVTGVDENLGRLLDALDELGLAEDTVVVYSSDNGYYLGEHCSGDKRSLYEESLRIPMLVRYPRLFGKGKVVDEMVLNIDLAPTFLDLAGVPVPKEMQGASWKELAAGRKPAHWRQSFFADYYKELGDVPTLYAVRTDDAQAREIPEPPRVDRSLRPRRRSLRNQEPRVRRRVDGKAGGRVGKADESGELHRAAERKQTSARRQGGQIEHGLCRYQDEYHH